MPRRLHVALIRASTLHRKRCREEFYRYNLSEGQPKVLAYLLIEEGVLQKDLAVKCGVKPATMTALLKKMLAEDLIRREAVYVSGGKRAFGIYLTPRGRDRAEKAMEVIDRMEVRSFQGFSPEEREQLVSLLDRVSQNLKN